MTMTDTDLGDEAVTGTRTASLPDTARLSPAASHTAFRELLSAFSRPGTPIDLAPIASGVDVHPALIPVLALADIEVAVGVIAQPDECAPLERLVARSTSATISDELSDADMVVAVRPPTADEIRLLRRGTAADPELGARLVIAVRCVHIAAQRDTDGSSTSDTGDTVRFTLTGPGSSAGRTVTVSGLDAGVLDALQAANDDHPTGIDTWLVADDGTAVGMPRSNRIDILDATDTTHDDTGHHADTEAAGGQH